MQIPQSEILTTQRLNRIFNNTVATYKFYWFLAILDTFVKKGKTRINVWELMISMVANAWYPVNYFRLSFGKSESLYQSILNLQKENDIPINLSCGELEILLSDLVKHAKVRRQLNFLQLNVPYRFLRPWINTSDDKDTMRRSQLFENDCLYKLEHENGCLWVELNPVWLDYLRNNYGILRDFTYWNLTLFLQTRNPNVPNIPNKIIKDETRNSLNKQREFWNAVIESDGGIHCIYTGRILTVGEFDLDHFIPWSFVSHDLLWNLMPADPSINCSKNNKLPDLSEYLPKLALAHQHALVTFLKGNQKAKILEDYLSLGSTAREIADMDKEHLFECFSQTFTPLNQIALNMGFERWHYNE